VNEVLSRAGQFVLDSVSIIQPGGLAIEIFDQIQQITLYEDIFSPIMSGHLVILDNRDIAGLLLNAGTDLLRLRLRTPTIDTPNQIDRLFHIYRMSDREVASERTQSYMLYFTAVENLMDTSNRISKTYRGKGEYVIGSILSSIGSTVKFTPTASTNDLEYTSNYWSPFQNINYAADRSIAQDGTASYLFFENRTGFVYAPLTQMALAKPSLSFLVTDQVADTDKTTSRAVKNIEMDYRSILKLTTRVNYDYDKSKRGGMLNSRLFSYDFVKKTLTDKTFNMNSDSRQRMNKNVFFKPEVIDSSYKQNGTVHLIIPKTSGLYGGLSATPSVIQSRISILQQYQQHKIEIDVFGRTDYTVGMTVNIDATKLKQISKDMDASSLSDPYYSGVYIISAICHRFSKDGDHKATIELMRDSIGERN